MPKLVPIHDYWAQVNIFKLGAYWVTGYGFVQVQKIMTNSFQVTLSSVQLPPIVCEFQMSLILSNTRRYRISYFYPSRGSRVTSYLILNCSSLIANEAQNICIHLFFFLCVKYHSIHLLFFFFLLDCMSFLYWHVVIFVMNICSHFIACLLFT